MGEVLFINLNHTHSLIIIFCHLSPGDAGNTCSRHYLPGSPETVHFPLPSLRRAEPASAWIGSSCGSGKRWPRLAGFPQCIRTERNSGRCSGHLTTSDWQGSEKRKTFYINIGIFFSSIYHLHHLWNCW